MCAFISVLPLQYKKRAFWVKNKVSLQINVSWDLIFEWFGRQNENVWENSKIYYYIRESLILDEFQPFIELSLWELFGHYSSKYK